MRFRNIKNIILFAGILNMLLFLSTMERVAYGQVPETPGNLQVVAGSGKVDLLWDVVAGADNYNLYLSRNPGVNNSNYKTKLGMKIDKVVSPYQLTGLNNDVTYYFVVTAENGSGESLASSEVSSLPQTILSSSVVFEDISIVAGLDQTKQLTFGNPICGDINNDGNLDILDSHHGRSISLYKNEGNGTFSDILVESGINPDRGIDRHGMALGDYDNDGNLDLFIGVGAAGGTTLDNSQLYKGDGTGSFIDVTAQAGINLLKVRTVNWIDYDNDGYLELFTALGGGTFGAVFKNDKSGFFNDITDSAGLVNAFDTVMSFADYDNDGDMDLVAGGTMQDKLYRNLGNGTFVLEPSFVGKQPSRGLAWGDYNNDGFSDLYVVRGTNDYHKALFWDQTNIDFSHTKAVSEPLELTFRCESGSNIKFDLRVHSQGWKNPSVIFIGDTQYNPPTNPFVLSSTEITGAPQSVDNTKDSFYVWKEDADSVWHVLFVKATPSKLGPGFSGHIETDGTFSEQVVNYSPLKTNYKNTLYRNNGDGTFTDVTEEAGVGHIGNNSGAAWGDFDNDGYLDLYAGDASDILGNRYNTLYHNLGNGTFEDITSSAGVSGVSAVGRHYGAVWADVNNDGTLDLFLSNGFGWGYPLSQGRSLLYKNPGNGNNWIKLKLIGTQSNRSGIGSRVHLQTSSGIQVRQLNGNGGELYSQGLAPLHFGLGEEVVIDSITIMWPSGVVQTLNQIPVNQELTITELDENRDQWTEEDDLSLWNVKFSGTSPVGDPINHVEGDYGISSTRTGTGSVAFALKFPENQVINQSTTSLRFQVYADDINEKLQFVRIHAPDWSNRFVYKFSPKLALNNGEWTEIVLGLSEFMPEAGSPGWGDVDLATLSFGGGSSSSDIVVDQLYFGKNKALSLVAHWKLDEGAGNIVFDSSGNDNSGTVQGGAEWGIGKIDGALSFDGIDDYVTVPAVNSQEMTLSAWIFKNSIDMFEEDFIFGGFRWSTNDQKREGFKLMFHENDPDKLGFILVTKDVQGVRTQKWVGYNLGDGDSVGRWLHVVVTFEQSTGAQKLYLDGVLRGIATHPAGNTVVPMTVFNNKMRIGAKAAWNVNVASGIIDGIIDDVRIYDKALSEAEVQVLFNSSSSL